MRITGAHLGSLVAAALISASLLGVVACGPDGDPEGLLSSSAWPVHTVCGGSSTVAGIDVSTWQGTVDWSQVKAAGIEFAIARVTHGTSTIDDQFAANWSGMKNAGIIRGTYQYFQPEEGGLAQADLLLQKLSAAGGLENGDLPVVLDLEATGSLASSAVLAAVNDWVTRIEQATNRTPIIYTGSYFWDDNQYGSGYASYPLWTAHYTSDACPLVANPWTSWTFWQYTSSGSVSGISGAVDRDRFNGTLADLKAFIAASVINKPGLDGPPPREDGLGPLSDQSLGPPDGGSAELPPLLSDGGQLVHRNEEGCSCAIGTGPSPEPRPLPPLLCLAVVTLVLRQGRPRTRS